MTKKTALPKGWTLTVEKEPTDTEAGNYQAIKTVHAVVVSEQHAQTMEALADGCAAYDKHQEGRSE